jgi:hypothetical protein
VTITAIKNSFNLSDRTVVLHNRENGRRYEMPSRQGSGMDEWVPWCWNEARFNENHRIDVRIALPDQEDIVYAIYQNNLEGGDLVRFSRRLEDPSFDNPGTALPGAPGANQAGGDRWLRVMEDFSLFIDYSGGPIP